MTKNLKNISLILLELSKGDMKILRLNQFLYLIQAWITTTKGKPAFEDNMLACLFGPCAIEEQKEFEELKKEFEKSKDKKIKNKFRKEIIFIYESFKEWTTSELMNLLHQYEPWKKAWRKRGIQFINYVEINHYHADRFEKKGKLF